MRKRNIEVKFRVTEQEYDTLMKKVKESGLSRNAFLVRTIKGQKIYPVKNLHELNEKVDSLLVQVRGMATNINQVAKIANKRKDIPAYEYLSFLKIAVQTISTDVQTVFTSIREVLHGNR